MKPSDNYVKIVEWSEIDQCYIGSCLGLMYGGCHGVDEKKVFQELCILVDEIIELLQENNEIDTIEEVEDKTKMKQLIKELYMESLSL